MSLSRTTTRRNTTFGPLKTRPKDYPWTLILRADRDGLEAVTEQGETIKTRGVDATLEALGRLKGHSVYLVPNHLGLVRAVGGRCEGSLWGREWHMKRLNTVRGEGWKTHCFPDLGAFTDDELVSGFAAFAGWVRGNGAGMTSLGTIATNIARAALDEPFALNPLPIAREAVYSGRKESRVYGEELHDKAYLDREAAYPNALAALDIPVRMAEVTDPDLSGQGIADASVTVPELPWSPAPFRLGPAAFPIVVWGWSDKPERGVFTFGDLRAVLEVGGKVRIHRAWVTVESVGRVFEPWLKRILDGKALGRFAGALVKTVGSKVWGSFLMGGRAGTRTWLDVEDGSRERARDTMDGRRVTPPCPQVSAFVDSAVRNEVFRDVLEPHGEHVHIGTPTVESQTRACA